MKKYTFSLVVNNSRLLSVVVWAKRRVKFWMKKKKLACQKI